MKVTIRQRIDMMRRAYPHIDASNARYMYAKPADLKRKGKTVAVWALLWAADGRTSMHKTTFSHALKLSVQGWAVELNERAPLVFRDHVIPHINTQSGSAWAVDRIVGWHFVDEGRAR